MGTMLEDSFKTGLSSLPTSHIIDVDDLDRVKKEGENLTVRFNDGDSERYYKISIDAFNAFLQVVYRPYRWYQFLKDDFPYAFDAVDIDKEEFQETFSTTGGRTITTSKTGILSAYIINELDGKRYEWKIKNDTIRRYYWNNFTPVLNDNPDVFFNVDIKNAKRGKEFITPIIDPPKINYEMEIQEKSVI